MALAVTLACILLYNQEIAGFTRMVLPEQAKVTDKQNTRGTIYDRKFKEIAVSLDRVSVYVRPRELEDIHESANQLAAVLGINEQELLGRLDQEIQRIWLAKDISLEEEKAVSDLHLPGVHLHQEKVRYYPYKDTAAHIIGFADHNIGLAGTEHYYNRLLDQASISQDDFSQVNLEGHYKTGISGQHLVLTIDLKIQDFLEKYVKALALAHEGVEIATLLMEADTGAIIASANFPSFDPNLFYQYKKENLANILLEPIVIPQKVQRFFQDAALLQVDWARYKEIYPWSIMAGSIDRGHESRILDQLGWTALPELDFAVQSGRGKGSGPEKDHEASGIAFADIPVTATPLQIALGMNALLSGHQVMPHVLDRVLERNGDREYFFKPSMPGDRLKHVEIIEAKADGTWEQSVQNTPPAMAETWKLFRAQGQKGVLDSVFIDMHDLFFKGYRLASDSAAADLPEIMMTRGGEYLRSKMMFALLPKDKPELILMVVVRQPYLEPSTASAKNMFDLAGPAAKILPSMVALHQVHKNISDMMSLSEKEEGNYHHEQEKKALVALQTILEQQQLIMPDLNNLSLRRALHLLQNKKVKIKIEGTGRVVMQHPAAGTSLNGVQECLLTLKKDKKAGKGISLREAIGLKE